MLGSPSILKRLSRGVMQANVSRRGGSSAFSVPFIRGIRPEGGVASALLSDTYVFNDVCTRQDHEGLIVSVPKHFPFVNGLRTEVNLLKDAGITDVSNWTQTNAAIAYSGGGEFSLTGLDGGTGDAVGIGALSGVSIVDREFLGVCLIKASGDDIGKTVRIGVNRTSGGTAISSLVTITLTGSYQVVACPVATGIASNTGIFFQVLGAASNNAAACTIKHPTIVEVTNKTNQNPPDPIPVDTAGAGEVYNNSDLTTSSGWTVTGSNVLTHVSSSTTLDWGSPIIGKRYTFVLDVSGVTAGQIRPSIRGGGADVDGTNITTNGHFEQSLTAATGNIKICMKVSADFDGTITYQITESTPGIEQFPYLNGNTVASGVVTQAQGASIVQRKWTKLGYKVPVEVVDNRPLWKANTAYALGDRVLPTDWMTNYGRQIVFECTTAGTSHATTEPTWPTTLTNTVADNTVTWTAIAYHTNRGFTIEPATTQDLIAAQVLGTGGSASTYPGNWVEEDTGAIGAVVAEGVSPIYSGARYVDVQVANSTGSNKTLIIYFSGGSSTTGISQGDDITVSVYLALIAGTIAGDFQLDVNERDSGDLHLTHTEGATLTLDSSLKQYSSTITTVQATVDRYRAALKMTNVPDGTDFTIRITLPNSCQQSFVTSTILSAATRSTQEASVNYPVANYSDDDFTLRLEASVGVAQANIATVSANLLTFDTLSGNRGPYLQADGDLGVNDGTAVILVTNWSEPTNGIMQIAYTHSANLNSRTLAVQSDNKVYAYDQNTYDGQVWSNAVCVRPGGYSLNYPITIHQLAMMQQFTPGTQLL